MSQCSKCNWNRYSKGYMKCVFSHELVMAKYHTSCLNDLTFNGNIFLFIKLNLLQFHVHFFMVINSKKKEGKIKVSEQYLVYNTMYYEWFTKTTSISKPLTLWGLGTWNFTRPRDWALFGDFFYFLLNRSFICHGSQLSSLFTILQEHMSLWP